MRFFFFILNYYIIVLPGMSNESLTVLYQTNTKFPAFSEEPETVSQ